MIRRLFVLAVLWNAGKAAAQIGYAWGHTDGYLDGTAAILDPLTAAGLVGTEPRKES